MGFNNLILYVLEVFFFITSFSPPVVLERATFYAKKNIDWYTWMLADDFIIGEITGRWARGKWYIM